MELGVICWTKSGGGWHDWKRCKGKRWINASQNARRRRVVLATDTCTLHLRNETEQYLDCAWKAGLRPTNEFWSKPRKFLFRIQDDQFISFLILIPNLHTSQSLLCPFHSILILLLSSINVPPGLITSVFVTFAPVPKRPKHSIQRAHLEFLILSISPPKEHMGGNAGR